METIFYYLINFGLFQPCFCRSFFVHASRVSGFNAFVFTSCNSSFVGDESFRSKDFKLAIQHYSAAIEIDPENIVLYSNRSAAYLANSDKSNALYDAQKCIDLDPKFVKGYTRYAAALRYVCVHGYS
jgi:tetratricopeptide (TPR) repeat protein